MLPIISSTGIFVGEQSLNITSANITYTPAEFFALKNAIFWQCVMFGYIAGIICFCIGVWVGYSWHKWRIEQLEDNEEGE